MRRVSATQIAFSVNGGTEQVVTAGLASALNPVLYVGTTAVSAKSIDIDYWGATVSGLAR
jgi:hypothetical protein